MPSRDLTLVLKCRDEASKALAKFGVTVQETEKRVGIAAGVLAAGIGALGAVAVNAAAEYEQSMSGIAAVSGATAGEMKQISTLALKLGKDTVFSAKEAANGIEELIKGGVSLADVADGAAKSMLDLAAAGQVSLPEAAEIAANALAMFSLKGKDMAHVADLIAGAANASSLEVNDFRYSMQMAGAVAALSGQTFDDLAVAIAVMGQSGVKGSDAGTSLKTMLMNLQPTTKKATEAMFDLGIVTKDGQNKFVDASGSIKSMSEIAEVLQTALAGLSEAERLMALEAMFGSDAIRAGAILSKAGAEGFDEMASAMGKVSAASVAAIKLDNMRGSVEELKGSVETLTIQLGTVLIPAIRSVVDWMTSATNVFIGLPPEVQTAILIVAGLTAGLAALVAIIHPLIAVIDTMKAAVALTTTILHSSTIASIAHKGALVAQQIATGAATVAQWLLNAALTANPIGIVVVALAALTAALIYAYQNSEEFRRIVDGAFASVKSVTKMYIGSATILVEGFLGVINGVVGAIKSLLDWIGKIPGSIGVPGVPSAPATVGGGGGAYALGGIVPGPIGRPQWAIVHGGETVMPAGRSARGSQGGTINYNLTVNTNQPATSIVGEFAMMRALAV